MDPLDDKVRLKAIEASMEGLKSQDWQARNAAILCLSAFGDDRARPAIPDLIAAIDRETTGLSVALALKRISPESAEPALIGLLKDPAASPGARAGAASGLRQMEAASAPALEALVPALADPDRNVQSAVRSALMFILWLRPAAIPRIIEKLKDPSPVARQNAAHVLGRLHWGEEPPSEASAIAPALAEALKDPEASVRRVAAEALYFTGESCDAAVPALAELVGDPDPSVRKEALKTLRYTGKEKVELVHALAAGLQDRDPGARVEAALGFAYRSRSPSGEEALKAIFMEGLAASDPKARAKALEGLRQTGCREDSAIATFVRHLKDPDPEVRESAALQINYVGLNDPSRAKAAVPALVEALADPDPGVRWGAARAIVRIEPGEPALCAFLKGYLLPQPSLRHFRVQAAALLLEIGAEVDAALKVLVEVMKDRRRPARFHHGTYCSTERNQAIHAILEHAPPRKDLISQLRALLDEPDFVLQIEIALALLRLDPENEAAFQIIVEAVKHQNKHARLTAVSGLKHVVKGNPRVVPLVLEALNDSSEGVRGSAMWSLEGINKLPVEVIPALINSLKSGSLGSRHGALDLLESMGPEAKAATPAILGILQSADDESTKSHALVALVKIGPSNPAALPPLLEALEGYDPTLRAWALVGLGKLGPAAVAAIPAIERALGDPNSRMRFRAAFTLHRIGASTESVVAVLKEAAMDPDEQVRNRALETLKQLGRHA